MELSNDSQLYESQLAPKNEEEKYKKIKVLGEGSMGKVYLVECVPQNNKLYVMKRINIGHLEQKERQQALSQAQLHNMVRHQNIIEFQEIYHTTKDKLCIIMEYAEGGDLDGLLRNLQQNKKTLSEEDILKYFTQICLALRQIHQKKIVHRDLKGANIFLTKDGKIKIGDFGISKAMDRTVLASKSFVGTPFYLSPEMVQGKPYSTKADIWALGVILYHMVALKLPFDANSLPVLALKILKGAYPQIPGNSYSKQIKNLISSMIQVDQRKRPSVNEILCKPILSKYLPKEIIITLTPKIQAKVELKVEKIKLATTKSKTELKVENQKLSEQQKKKKREQQKLKRQEERKKMKEDIKNKRNQIPKDQKDSRLSENGQHNKIIQVTNSQTFQETKKPVRGPAQKTISRSKNIKEELQKSPPKLMQKPWKNKNFVRQKKEPEIQIVLPGQRKKSAPKIQAVSKALKKVQDFNVEIFVNGENPYKKIQNQQLSPFNNSEFSEKEGKNLISSESFLQSGPCSDFSYQIEEAKGNYSENKNGIQDLLANVKKAQFLVSNLDNPYQENNIELYEESADFDNTTNFHCQRQNPTRSSNKFQNNESDIQNMKYITNITDTQNLEELRQILQDRLGDQNFIKSLAVVKEHFEEINKKKANDDNDTQDSDAYLFNRIILKEKLHFLNQEQFERNIELLYTISVMQDLEMMKNFQTDSSNGYPSDYEEEEYEN